MSGIEVVGVVLGAIPLIISGLEHYGKGAAMIRSTRNYPQEFKNMSRRLRIEAKILKNALESVLSGCVENSMLPDMLDDPDSEIWRDVDIENSLRERLQDDFDIFIESIQSMNNALEEFKLRLKLCPDGKAPFAGPKKFEEAYRRLKFALKKDSYSDLLEEISRDNTALVELTKQNIVLEPVRSRRKRKGLDVIRSRALEVFANLQKYLNASCNSTHTASLCIKDVGQANSKQAGGISREASFRVVLHHVAPADQSVSWICNETEIRLLRSRADEAAAVLANGMKRTVRFLAPSPVGMPKPDLDVVPKAPVEMHEIQDLCGSMMRLETLNSGVCLGYLPHPSTNMRHGVYRPGTPILDRSSLSVLSLREVLDGGMQTQPLSIAKRRELAAELAAGMMRLYDTPWLAKQWGHQEIVFFRKGGAVLTDHPFISTGLQPSQPAQILPQDLPKYFDSCPAIQNETLFALGILLIELCFNKPFEGLISADDLNADGTRHAASEYCAALRLAKKMGEEASWRYVDAVRHCIQCPFTLGVANLENDVFREAVYEKVIAVLEEEAVYFRRS
ncbi:hypothetical protein Q7P37_009653 [Cladosporium fusiforme]